MIVVEDLIIIIKGKIGVVIYEWLIIIKSMG